MCRSIEIFESEIQRPLFVIINVRGLILTLFREQGAHLSFLNYILLAEE